MFLASMLPEYGQILISASDNKGVDLRSESLFRCNAGPRHKLTPRSEQPCAFLLPDCKRRSDNVPRRRLDSLSVVSKLSDYVRLSAERKCHPL